MNKPDCLHAPRLSVSRLLFALAVWGVWLSPPPVSGEDVGDPSLAFLTLNDSSRAWVNLFTGTRENEEITLLDRSVQDALLQERAFLLHARGEERARFDLCAWVSADILIVVETVEESEADPGAVWFRALDVLTGVRLVDKVVALNLENPGEGVEAINDLLRQNVLPSWRTLWRKGREFAGVTLLDIRLVDAPEGDRHVYSSLHTMLERMIVQYPSLVLLERNLLESLLREESLSPALRLDLQSSVVMLSGFIHQETEGPVFTLRGTTPENQNVFAEEFPLDGTLHPKEIAARALRLLSDHSPNRENPGGDLLRQEARRFYQLARYYQGRKEPERALDAAITARALNPSERRYAFGFYEIYREHLLVRILAMQDPGPDELSELLADTLHLFQNFASFVLTPLSRTSGDRFMKTVSSHFGENIRNHADLQMQWEKIETIYERSLENRHGIFHRFHPRRKAERNALITSYLTTHRPIYLPHLRQFFDEREARSTRNTVRYSTSLPLESLLQLIRIAEERPYVSEYVLHQDSDNPNVAVNDLFIRNLILSVLAYAASEQEDSQEDSREDSKEVSLRDKTIHHMEQFALLMIQNPSLWMDNQIQIVRHFPRGYHDMLKKVFVETRNRIEKQGWIVPEFYFLDDWDSKPGIIEKILDSSLRLVSNAEKPDHFPSLEEELTQRLSEWIHPDTGRRESPVLPPPEISFPEAEDVYSNMRNWRWKKHHSKIWGNYLIVHALKTADEVHAPEVLHVYEKNNDEFRLVKTLRFPHSDVEMGIDPINEKRFYQMMMRGKRHLYYSHQHSLYQFDEKMNLVRSLDLEDWNFPGHMAANLLETSRGIFVVLAKKHILRKNSPPVQFGGNTGGVLVLADEKLERVRILANIERPVPRNDLDAAGPFETNAFYQDTAGNIIMGHYNQGITSWFEIGGDLVPTKRNRPENLERIRVWVASFGMEDEAHAKFMETFCEQHGKAFGLRVGYHPGRLPYHTWNFRRVVPFGDGLIVLGTVPGGESKGLFYVPKNGTPEDARMMKRFSGTDFYVSLDLWDGDVVLNSSRSRHSVIRKEDIDAFLSEVDALAPGRGPFPGEAHMADQKEFQKRFKEGVAPYVAQDVEFPDSQALDHLVRVPGGTFPLHPRDNSSHESPQVTFPDFFMSDTKVTQEEFIRVYRWALHNGYTFTSIAEFIGPYDLQSHMLTRPVFELSVADAMLYCNARSEWEGLRPAYYLDEDKTVVLRRIEGPGKYNRSWTNDHVDWNAGYRLPTEAEWEYVARAADPGHVARYPWGDTISHDVANYLAADYHAFDRSTGGLHPVYAAYTIPVAPVKAFPPHGFENRFYGMVGNVAEIVWDRREWEEPDAEPLPPRPLRYKGGSWGTSADASTIHPPFTDPRDIRNRAFRVVLPAKGP